MTSLLTIPEAAELARVTTRSVKRWIERGCFPVCYAGKLVRIDRAVFEAWLKRSPAWLENERERERA